MIDLLAQFGLAGLTVASVGQALMRRFPARAKESVPPKHVEPVLPRPCLDIERAAAVCRAGDRRIVEDPDTGRVYLERPARHRSAYIAKEKIMARFLAWMIDEGYSGWYTPDQIYESFQEFAWDQALEEIDRCSFLALLAVEPGVIKRRAYIQKNETYKHLRAVLRNQERATVYRIPTGPELAAVKHKRALQEAERCQGRGVAKVRLEPGGRQQARPPAAHRNGLENKDLGLPTSAYGVAA